MTVQITSPPDGYTFAPSSSATPVVFTAIVHDEHGNVIHVPLQWMITGYGSPGAGSPLTASLPPNGKMTVGVIALRLGPHNEETATDAITVTHYPLIP